MTGGEHQQSRSSQDRPTPGVAVRAHERLEEKMTAALREHRLRQKSELNREQVQTAIDKLDDISTELVLLTAYLVRSGLTGMEMDVQKLKSNVDSLIEYWRMNLEEG
jgi:transketolase